MLDNKTEQKWPLAEEAKAEFVKGHFFFVLLGTQAKNAGGVASSAHRYYFAAGEKPRSIKQRSCGGQFPITTAAVFLRNEKVPFFHGTGRKRKRNLGGLLTCVSIDGPVSLLGIIQWLTFVTAGHLDTYSAGSVGNRTPFSCSAPPPARLPGHQIRYLLLLKR